MWPLAIISAFLMWGLTHLHASRRGSDWSFVTFQLSSWLIAALAIDAWRQQLYSRIGIACSAALMFVLLMAALTALMQFQQKAVDHLKRHRVGNAFFASCSMLLMLLSCLSQWAQALAPIDPSWPWRSFWHVGHMEAGEGPRPWVMALDLWARSAVGDASLLVITFVAIWVMGLYLQLQRDEMRQARGKTAQETNSGAAKRHQSSVARMRPTWRVPPGHDDPRVLVQAACLDLCQAGGLQLQWPAIQDKRPPPLLGVDPYLFLVLVRTLLVQATLRACADQPAIVQCEQLSPPGASVHSAAGVGNWRLVIASGGQSSVDSSLSVPTPGWLIDATTLASRLGLRLEHQLDEASMKITLELFRRPASH